MSVPTFLEILIEAQARRSSVLCVGLDPDPERLPPHLLAEHPLADAVIKFNRAIIEATAPAASAFKLNLAFYEALGADAWRVLTESLEAVPTGVVTIADGKRGDIGNSARFYARAAFDQLGFDAVTVSGYMGRDSVAPFLQFDGRGAFLLVRTSNPGARDVQEAKCDQKPFYLRMARLAQGWGKDMPGSLGFVVGATDTGALRAVRTACPDVPLLIPGVGAQGGDAEAVMQIAAHGKGPVVINSSRSIIYASGDHNFAEAAASSAQSLRSMLEGFRPR